MIKGARKSEGGSGHTPQPKVSKTNDDDWPELDDSKGAKDMMKDMWAMMKEMQKDAHQAKYVAQLASESAESAHKEISNVKSSICDIEQDIKDIKNLLQKPTNHSKTNMTVEEDLRELQVIIGGLKHEQDENQITTQINNILNTVNMKQKTNKSFVFSDPSQIGVVEFKTMGGKVGFLKKMSTVQTNGTMAITCGARVTTKSRSGLSTKSLASSNIF